MAIPGIIEVFITVLAWQDLGCSLVDFPVVLQRPRRDEGLAAVLAGELADVGMKELVILEGLL